MSNMTNITNVTNVVNAIAFSNSVTNNLFGIFVWALPFLVLLFGMGFYNKKDGFLAASVIWAMLTILMSVAGLISGTLISVPIICSAAALMWRK